MKCNRYVFTYESTPEQVEEYIYRADSLAESTYGRSPDFSRLQLMLDNARLLGWNIPAIRSSLPEELTELSSDAIALIFENQCKILIDVSPVSKIQLEDHKEPYPIRMLGSATPAGDLLWRCHLLLDKSGQPYVRQGNKLKVKTRGAKIYCNPETVPYNSQTMADFFGGEHGGVWPVPFLPECFSDHQLAKLFMAEQGVTEVVTIEEKKPVSVLVKKRVSWYRELEIDRSKAHQLILPKIPTASEFLDIKKKNAQEEDSSKFDPDDSDIDDSDLLGGESHSEEDEPYTESEEDSETEASDDSNPQYTNVIVDFTPTEAKFYKKLETDLSKSTIKSKKEAESLRKIPEKQKEADQWLLNAVNRVVLIANASNKIGAIYSIIQKHSDSQIFIVQPRDVWAKNLSSILNTHGLLAEVIDTDTSKATLQKFKKNITKIVISTKPLEDFFLDEVVIIIASSFNKDYSWQESLNPSHQIYAISIKSLGFDDANLIQGNPYLDIESEVYSGPPLHILKEEELKQPSPKKDKKSKTFKLVIDEKETEFKSMSDAKTEAQLKELDGKVCKILDPEGNITYTTGEKNT